MPREKAYDDIGEIRKKGGGGRLSRSETVTVRLDPKLRYLAELAARKQRRTLSSFIEWAVEESLGRVVLYEGEDYDGGPDVTVTVASRGSSLWDVDDSDRFIKLALAYPELLTHEDQVLWKLIRNNGSLWRGSFDKQAPHSWTWLLREPLFKYENLRKHWNDFVAVANGEAEESILPTWEKTGRPAPTVASPPAPKIPSKKVDELDEEIPF